MFTLFNIKALKSFNTYKGNYFEDSINMIFKRTSNEIPHTEESGVSYNMSISRKLQDKQRGNITERRDFSFITN